MPHAASLLCYRYYNHALYVMLLLTLGGLVAVLVLLE